MFIYKKCLYYVYDTLQLITCYVYYIVLIYVYVNNNIFRKGYVY